MSKPEDSNPIRTVNNALELIPVEWRDAELFVGDTNGRIIRVLKISLEQNTIGRRVVVLSVSDFSPK